MRSTPITFSGTILFCLIVTFAGRCFADDTPDLNATAGGSYPGYTLFAPLKETTTYLIDNDGLCVHFWNTDYRPGNAVYLLQNRQLLHTGNAGNAVFQAGGAGGLVQTIDWFGNLIWEYEYNSSQHLQHHDVEMLPNGIVLMIAWQYKTAEEAIAAGRPDGNYSSIDEIVPPVDANGNYTLTGAGAYGPESPVWVYTADNPTDFYARNISGQQRLPNGNTLICDGPGAIFFEVTASGETVWQYQHTDAVFRVERYAPTFAGFDQTFLDDE